MSRTSIGEEQSIKGQRAVAVYTFEGQPYSAELSFRAGDALEVYVIDASAGWSLGACRDSSGEWQRGLIPQRFYKIIEDVLEDAEEPAEGKRPEAEHKAEEVTNQRDSIYESPLNSPTAASPSIILHQSPSEAKEPVSRIILVDGEEFAISPLTPTLVHSEVPTTEENGEEQSYFEERRGLSTDAGLGNPEKRVDENLTLHLEIQETEAAEEVEELQETTPEEPDQIANEREDEAKQEATSNVENGDSTGRERAPSEAEETAAEPRTADPPATFDESRPIQEEPSPPQTVSKAAARLDRYFEDTNHPGLPQTSSAALPSVISRAVYTRPSGATTANTDAAEAGPNLQPLPPVFSPPLLKRSPSERKADLGRLLSSHSIVVKQAARSGARGKGKLEGGWVSSGAEAWIAAAKSAATLSKTERRKLAITEAERSSGLEEEAIFIDPGPSWQSKSPNFDVSVHTPHRQGDFTVFRVTSVIEDEEGEDAHELTVDRRYSQFLELAKIIEARYRAFVLPPLPQKAYTGRFDAVFLKQRQLSLHHWLRKVVGHPVLRESEPCRIFLSSNSDSETLMAAMKKTHWKETVFDHIYFDEFNLDADKLEEEVVAVKAHFHNEQRHSRFGNFERSISNMRQSASESVVRNQEMARQLYAIISEQRTNESEDGKEHFCWRTDCTDCLNLTKALQVTAEAHDSMANLDQDWISDSLLEVQTLIKLHSDPESQIAGLANLYSAAASGLKAVSTSTNDEETEEGVAETIATRCETLLNVVGAELDHLHSERVQDMLSASRHLVDSTIEKMESQLEQLRRARGHLDEDTFAILHESGPRLRSRLKEMGPPLPQPLLQPAEYTLGGKSAATEGFGLANLAQWIGVGSSFRQAPEAP